MVKNMVRIELSKILEPLKPDREKVNRESVQELSDSMKKYGQLQPILVLKENAAYRIEAGHRRFCAAQMLGWAEIDAVVLEASGTEHLHLIRAHENFHREQLNPIEESKICWRLCQEDGLGVEKTARELCKTLSWVDTRLEIAKMPPDIKASIALGEIKVAVAKELCKVKNHETRERLLKSAVEYGASAAVVRRWVNDSSVGQFLEQSEVQAACAEGSAIDRSQVTMPCRICNISQLIDVLRHIWICPDCMGAMRELAREKQKQLHMAGTGGIE